jgi:hypothetical protein
MGSFQRAFLGYRRPQVDAAIAARDSRIEQLARQVAEKAEMESELNSLAGMVLERERENRGLRERLLEADERYEHSIASLDSVTARLQEIEAQARGQATRIRMKALREAVEVGRRAQELTEAAEAEARTARTAASAGANGAAPAGTNGAASAEDSNETAEPASDAQGPFEGTIRLDIGPLGDYSQLVGIEDAIGSLGASEISIERFSEGRATLSMNLDEPVDLLRELEERAPLDFRVRRAAEDNLVLDVDDDEGSGNRAA